MGVSWGGVGHGSQCHCGNKEPPPGKILHNDAQCTADACSGNKTENCGGNWRTQVYSVACPAAPPPAPSTKAVWIPPGSWVPWNTSGNATSHNGPQVLHNKYDLHEIPLFARAGAVVPVRTLARRQVHSQQPEAMSCQCFAMRRKGQTSRQPVN
jgi:hypothetical protein